MNDNNNTDILRFVNLSLVSMFSLICCAVDLLTAICIRMGMSIRDVNNFVGYYLDAIYKQLQSTENTNIASFLTEKTNSYSLLNRLYREKYNSTDNSAINSESLDKINKGKQDCSSDDILISFNDILSSYKNKLNKDFNDKKDK